MKAQLVPMKAGDTLFFNGSLIHGSGPNRSKDRFRRSFICHYVSQSHRENLQILQPSGHHGRRGFVCGRKQFGRAVRCLVERFAPLAECISGGVRDRHFDRCQGLFDAGVHAVLHGFHSHADRIAHRKGRGRTVGDNDHPVDA